MKLFKKMRKGFTLIELVVVIAVIAILSAVAVVSYISITNRAKESNDHLVIDQINTSLLSSQILEKKATVHEIVERFDEEEGYDVRTIKPELKNARFVYSYENGKFGYWKDNKVAYPADLAKIDFTGSNDLWFFEDEAIAEYKDSYSHYLKSAGSVTSITINGGIDVGGCKTISSINYTRTTKAAKDVVIRTNTATTSLTINAASDKVYHYGVAGSVDIIAIANASYHENGTVAFLEIAKGRVALESESKVSQIHISTKVTDYDEQSGEKTKQANTFDQVIVALANGVTLPEFSRDKVAVDSIGEGGTLVVEIEKGNDESDFIYLYQQGLLGQIRVTTGESTNSGENVEAKAIDSSAKKGTDTSLEQNTSSIAEDIANNLESGSTATIEQIETGNVSLEDVVDTGLTNNEKEEQKESVVAEIKYKDYIDGGYSFVVGNTGYRTLKEAFDNVEDNQTINLIQNLDFKISVDEITDETHTNWFGSGFSNGHIKSYIHLHNKKGIIFNLNGFTMDVDYTLNFLDYYNSNERVAKKVFIYLSGEGSLLITNGTMNVKFDYKNRAATANGTSAYNSSYEYSAIYVHNNPASPGSKNENVTYDIPYQTELSVINCSITSNQVPLRLHHGAVVKELNANIMYYCENAEKVSEGKSTNVNIYNVQNNNNHCIHLMAGSKLEKITGGSYTCCDQRELDDPNFPMQNQGSALYVTEGFRASATYYPQVYVPRAEVGEISGGVFKSNGAYPVEIKGYVEKLSGGLFYRIEGTYAGRNTMYFNPTIIVSHPDDNAGIGCITGGTFIGGSNPNRPDGLNNIIVQRPKGGSGVMTYPSLADFLGEGYAAQLNESLSYDVTTSRTTEPIVIRCYAYDVVEASE